MNPENQKQIISQNTNKAEEITASSSSTSKQINLIGAKAEIKNQIQELKNEKQKLDKEYGAEINDWKRRNSVGEIIYQGELEMLKKKQNDLWALGQKILSLENQLSFSQLYEESYSMKQEEGAASTSEGKEIIKAEITQELEKARNIFENFQINPIEYSKAKNEIKEKLLELHERRGCEAEINLLHYPKNSSLAGFILGNQEIQAQKHEKAQIVAAAMGKVVMKMASDTITDLQAHKDKIVKKINKLIDARKKEITEAREIIKSLQTINQEAKAKNKDLKEKSDREISNLQKSIEELNKKLKNYEVKAQELKNEATKYYQPGKTKLNATMTSPEIRIKELETELERATAMGKMVDEGWELEKKEVERLKGELERTTTRLNADLEAKENELERERKIFTDQMKESGDKIKKLEREITNLKTKIDEKDDEINQQQPAINELRGEKDRLTNLLTEAQAKNQKLEADYKALTEKSLFYKAMDKLGIASLKNSISNIATIAGLVVIIYGISWMWKNLIKTAYKNFKGEPKPKNNHEPTPPIPTNQNQQPTPAPSYYQPPKYSPVLSIENNEPPRIFHDSEKVRILSNESPKNEPRRDKEKNSELTEKSPEPAPAKKKSKKRKKNSEK